MRKLLAIVATLTVAACSDGGSGAPSFTCANGGRPLRLAVGEVRPLTAAEKGAFCVRAAGEQADYLLVPFHAADVAATTVELEVSAPDAVAPGAGLVAERGATVSGASVFASVGRRGGAAGEPEPNLAFHRRLRRIEQRQLAPRMHAARQARGRSAGVNLSRRPRLALRQNELVSFNASTEACTNPVPRGGRVVAITEHAIVVADTANPSGGFTDDEYREIGIAFDTTAYPVDVANFGEPQDIDGNGKVIIFFTRAVNELTPKGSKSLVGGFFFSRDLFPKEPIPAENYDGCAGSNEAEMFYMLVPDLDGTVNSNPRDKEGVRRRTVSVLAHEFQHLINASRRLYVNGANDFEEIWLNEGLSHIAEELAFYKVAGLAPRQNIDLSRLRSSPAILTAVNGYQVSNLSRLLNYVENPEGNSPYANNDSLTTRGGTWQLLRYAADRKGGAEAGLWRSLVDAKTSGAANFEAAFGSALTTVVQDWTVAQYLDDTDITRKAEYVHPSWNFRSLLPALSDVKDRFPLKTQQLTDAAPATLSLVGGGAAYLRFGVPADVVVPVTTTVQGSPPPADVELTLVRIK